MSNRKVSETIDPMQGVSSDKTRGAVHGRVPTEETDGRLRVFGYGHGRAVGHRRRYHWRTPLPRRAHRRHTTPLTWDTADPLAPLAAIGDQPIIGDGHPWATGSGPLHPYWQHSIGRAPTRGVRAASNPLSATAVNSRSTGCSGCVTARTTPPPAAS
jgi:hypothetical protein